MNPFSFARRRPISTLVLLLGLTSCGILALKKAGFDIAPTLDTTRITALFDGIAKGEEPAEQPHHERAKIVATSPKVTDVTLKQPYVCQIHSRRHINVCALESGFLEEILVKEGQAVKKGDPLFKILPVLYQAKLDAEVAEAQLAQLEFNNTTRLAQQKVVSPNEVLLLQAKLSKAQAKVKLAKAELNFTNVVAQFDGIVDRCSSGRGA